MGQGSTFSFRKLSTDLYVKKSLLKTVVNFILFARQMQKPAAREKKIKSQAAIKQSRKTAGKGVRQNEKVITLGYPDKKLCSVATWVLVFLLSLFARMRTIQTK